MGGMVVDITPHPRILSVLGEIEFKPWQCIAELMDNSIDGFLTAALAHTPVTSPEIRVAIGRNTVVVKDNGPGMSLDTLENAVKAGWTSHERFGSLGLYGVGFNIATARLGSSTTIWTAQPGDTEWYGLQIDLNALVREGTYQLKVMTRPKSDIHQSGTEVKVEPIRRDWVGNLNNPNWLKHNVTDRLARVYGTMLRENHPQPIGFSLLMNDRRVKAWEHCIWPEDVTVFRRDEGDVSPVSTIDVTFGTRYVSKTTGEIYDQPDELVPEDRLEVPERIYGWLGIQRYPDENEYGIDILRNGRKIEIGCKDLFYWEDADGTRTSEYPIDDPRGRGRIVGEIHLDHGYVHYTKHRFEREHTSWTQLLRAIRNEQPLTRRERRGYSGVNNSPLGLLFRVFRRNSPAASQTYRDVLVMPDVDIARQWAEEFRKGNSEYRSIRKWLDEIQKADEKRRSSSSLQGVEDGTSDENSVVSGLSSKSPDGDGQSTGGNPEVGADTSGHPLELDLGLETGVKSQIEGRNRESIRDLTLHIAGIGHSNRTYDVEVYSVDSGADRSDNSPWRSRISERGVFEIEVDFDHPLTNSLPMRLRDMVLADVAHYMTSEENSVLGVGESIGYGEIFLELQQRLGNSDSLDITQLRTEIDELRKRFVSLLETKVGEDALEAILENFPEDEARRIRLSQARRRGSSLLSESLEMRHLTLLFRSDPSLFLDTRDLAEVWTPSSLASDPESLADYQRRLVDELWFLMSRASDFLSDLGGVYEPTRNELMFIRSCVNRMREYLVTEGSDERNL